MAKRLLFNTNKRLLWNLAYKAGFKGIRSVQRHKKRLKQGDFFPPFLYISIINSCNLRCQGCWVDVAAKQEKIDVDKMNDIIGQAKEMGNSFFGLLGGEPFLHKEILQILEDNRDVYFQIFTNGHYITPKIAKELNRLGNVTPLISVEGTEIASNERRGKLQVLNNTMEGLHNCLSAGLLTGVCTSVCQTNYEDLVNDAWIDRLIELGVMYGWFHIYRPVGPDACPELALTPEQQFNVRKFVVETRAKKPIVMIDAYHDGDGNALCPAATGFTHHISPWGDIEPCPIIQFSKESIYDDRPLKEVFNESEFLTDFRKVASESTRGCIILERPDLLRELAEKHDAKDTTIRGEAVQELEEMEIRPSQYNPGNEIPEQNIAYRLAKKFWFNDYGTYSKHFQADKWIDTRTENPQKPG
ncbi:MAG: radical SAM protein [Planctomycetaceae bacterium]|nr:radical SAM protein [Planctomycetaceae bacterium]